jgi:hypothetical protein
MAVVPAFTSAAQAAATAVTLTPDTVSAPAGTCQQFTATTTNNGSPATATVDVQLAPRDSSATAISFCTATGANGVTPEAPANQNAVGVNGRNGEFVTGTDGTVVFGVATAGTTGRTVDVTAYLESAPGTVAGQTTGDGIPNGTEPKDTSTLTFTGGGPAAVTAVTAAPKTAVDIAGTSYTFTATAVSGTAPVPGVTPVFDVTSGPDAVFVGQTACGVTDQAGVANCTFTNQGGTGNDSILVYVNKTSGTTPDTNDPNAPDTNEPQDTAQVTFQAQQPAGTTITVTCTENQTNTAGTTCSNPTSDGTAVFTATVKNAAGAVQQGVAVSFTGPVSGGTADAPNTDTETLSATQCLTGANGSCSVTLTDTKPTNGETLTVTGRITNTGNNIVTAASTVTFHDPATAEARYVTLTPESATGTVGSGIVTLTAKATDRFGNPVPGVEITFTEGAASGQAGTGRFVNNSSTFVGVTNAAGQVTAELRSEPGEAPGSTTVTASITGFRAANGTITPRQTGTTNDECEQAANTTTAAAGSTGNAPGTTAGNCDDSSVVTFTSGSPSPSPSPTGAPVPATLVLKSAPTITPGTASVMEGSGTPNADVELRCYSRTPQNSAPGAPQPPPFFTARQASLGSTGRATFTLLPGTNTRCFLKYAGVADTHDAQVHSIVQNVATGLSLSAYRDGVRQYHFQGTNLPRRAGQLITLYRYASGPNHDQYCVPSPESYTGSSNTSCVAIRTATALTNSSNVWRIDRTFTGSGQFYFVVRTSQTLTNAAGFSNQRLTVIH